MLYKLARSCFIKCGGDCEHTTGNANFKALFQGFSTRDPAMFCAARVYLAQHCVILYDEKVTRYQETFC
jgi:hypothetical protein